MKFIKAKFASKCAETGKSIRKGDEMLYDYAGRKCYHMESATASQEIMGKVDSMISAGDRGAADMVQAQEDAYYDRAQESEDRYFGAINNWLERDR